MTLKHDDFPSSEAFELISQSLKSDDKARKEAVSQGQAIFAFKLKNAAGKEEAWHIDMKETGTVGRGEAPAGKKANVTLSLKDEDFAKLVSGKGNPQNMFMSGKLKVKGDVMKATKMQPILSKAGGNTKL